MKVDFVVEESIDFVNKSLNKQVDMKTLKECVVQPVITQLDPFVKSMNLKFEKCFDIPDCVPLLDQVHQNVSQDTVDKMKAQFDVLIKTYMRVCRCFILSKE